MMRPDPSRVNAQTSKAVQMRLSSYIAGDKLITIGKSEVAVMVAADQHDRAREHHAPVSAASSIVSAR
jgi:hypothetical protein